MWFFVLFVFCFGRSGDGEKTKEISQKSVYITENKAQKSSHTTENIAKVY